MVVFGAVALGHHLVLERDTKDVDLALALEADALERLLVPLGWSRDRFAAQRWNGPDAFRADVLPVTEADIGRGSIQFEDGARAMSLVGFDLVYAHAGLAVLVAPGR